jgi:hypothetical protein
MATYTNTVTRDVDGSVTGYTDTNSTYSPTGTVLRVINSEQALLITTGEQSYKEAQTGKIKLGWKQE